MDRPKNATVAKWGAACAPCASVKAKCIRSNETPGTKCDRCERLEKDCSDQVHRPRKKRQVKPSKTAQLEERLNSLVDLIKASNAGELPANFINPPSIEDDISCIPAETDLNSEQHRPSLTSIGSTDAGYTPATTENSSKEPICTVPATYNDYAPSTCICRAPVGEAPIPVESDETLLSVFVTKLSPQFPFVVLRPDISVQELNSTRPFLFSTIKMVASVRHLRSMRAQSYLVMKHISEHMLLRSERSLDLLQSILLMAAWHHHHCMMHSQMNNLTSLANSLVADLGFNRSPELQERTRLLVLNPEQPKARTNDERRAFCGTWYLNSVISLAFQKMDEVRFTPYLDQCVRELAATKEYETDVLLIQLMRIQNLSDRIAQFHAKDNMQDDLPGIPRAPLSAYLNAFQTELDKYKAQVPRHLKSHSGLQIHINTATLRLWEPPIVDPALLESLSNSFTSMSLGSASTLDIFYRSNAAIKAWFECWLSIKVTDYFYLNLPSCVQLIVAVTMLARWAKISSADPPPNPQAEGSLHAQFEAQDISDPSRAGPESSATESKLPEDPRLPAAIASIRPQIFSQPGLQIDIVGVLRALTSRFEEARSQVNPLQDGNWENNIWDLAAKKIGITRLKLERWTEIMSTKGIEGLLTRKTPPGEASVPDAYTGCPSEQHAALRAGPMEGVEVNETMSFPVGLESWQYNNTIANDLFDGLGLDQNFFYDDSGDYGTIILNSIQNDIPEWP